MRNERGAALLLAVVALVAIGMMAAGTFLAGWVELQGARAGWHGVTALEAAEQGAALAVAAWRRPLSRLAQGADSLVRRDSSASAGHAVTVTRLGGPLFLLRSEGWAGSGGVQPPARRTIGLFVRLVPLEVDRGSAVAAAGPLRLADSSAINGDDEVPAGWPACGPPGSAVPAVRSGGAGVAVDSGPAPVVVLDTALTPAAIRAFGARTFDQLAAAADADVAGTVVPVPAASGGRCAEGDPANWGEPLAGAGSVPECSDYLPVIHSSGSLVLAGGRGQGTLLVAGDLELGGGAEFYGVVVVLGRVATGSGGGRIVGTLLVAGAGGESVLGPGARVEYAACTVSRAAAAAGVPGRLREGAWAELY